MKKILAVLLSAFALSATAKETITIVYSWTASDVAANFYRTLADESNKLQNDYTFIVEYKPGAGGTVAAKYVDNTPGTVLANSSALFIRPLFFPADSHDIASYRSLMPMCVAPMYISSVKYKNWKEVPKDAKLSIGVSGMGTTTHLVAAQVSKNYPNMTVVPFKSTSEALLSVLSNNTDFAVNFAGDVDSWVKSNTNAPRKVNLLGVTGSHPVKGVINLSAQGFVPTLADMSSPQQLFASVKMPDAKVKEIRGIFLKAAQAKSVKDANAADGCIPNSLSVAPTELDAWYSFQSNQWKRAASGIKIDK